MSPNKRQMKIIIVLMTIHACVSVDKNYRNSINLIRVIK